MPVPTESEIHSRVEAFANVIVELARASALEVVNEALIRGTTPPGRGRTAPSRRTSASPARPKGVKRDPRDIAALTGRLEAFIKTNPGRRMEEIGKALGSPTKDLVLPVRKLIASKRIATKGKKRATTYFAR